MFIHWTHHYIPKVCIVFSILINSLLIYVVRIDKKVELGNYRIILFFFASYNLMSTIGDVVIPVGVHDYKAAFSVFIVGGYFLKSSEVGVMMVSLRCSFVPGSYGILNSHFVYRYMVLFAKETLNMYFLPYGLILAIFYTLFLMTVWFLLCYIYVKADYERKLYMQKSFEEVYETDVFDLNILIAQYHNVSSQNLRDSWKAVLSGSAVSVISVTIYAILGYQIFKKLTDISLIMSPTTRRLQKQLMKALGVQSTIPMMVSFLPCLIAWYLPALEISVDAWMFRIVSIAISFFPVLDPLALFYFVPAFRHRVAELFFFDKCGSVQVTGSTTFSAANSTVVQN